MEGPRKSPNINRSTVIWNWSVTDEIRNEIDKGNVDFPKSCLIIYN